MKFRATISEILAIHQLTRVAGTVAKMAKVCVLRLTTDRVYFIMLEKNTGSLWCEIPQRRFFEQYNMEGLSDEQNEIYLEMAVDSLVRALRSAHSAKSIKIKLTRKHGASLTVEVQLASVPSRSQLLVHDIPVTVVAGRLWKDFDEPDMPAFDVKVVLPAVKILRNVVDRIRNFSNHVSVLVSRSGTLALRVQSDEVTVKTSFEGLDVAFTAPIVAADEPIDDVLVQADIRKVAQFLAGQQLIPDSIICNIVRHRMIHFLVVHDDVTLQYFIPAVEA